MTAPAIGKPAALIDRLPKARGRLAANAPLGPTTWFRVGGPAEVLFRPADAADLADFLAALPGDIPVTVIGVASNLLVRDGGIPGVTIRLGRGFAQVGCVEDDVSAGAGALDINVALAAAGAGIAGLEFLSGVPGTIGGGLRMNAGAYGGEIKDVLVHADAVDRSGASHRVTAGWGCPTVIATRRSIGSSPAPCCAGGPARRARSLRGWERSGPRAKPRSRSARAPAVRPSPTRRATARGG
jgi:UDP-N-acetylmuramate dehydrogenase